MVLLLLVSQLAMHCTTPCNTLARFQDTRPCAHKHAQSIAQNHSPIQAINTFNPSSASQAPPRMIIRGQAQAAAAMRQPGRTHFSPTSSSSATTRAPLRPRQSSHQPPRHTHTQQAATAASHQQQHSTAQQQQQQQQHDRRFDDLAAWLEARGGSVGSITAGDCQMGPVLVRGLLATQDLTPSTPILSVPVSATLQDTRAPQPYPGAPWNVCLAALLLTERDKGHSSSFAPYLATLPASCCSPLLLPQQQLAEVQYAPAVAAIAAFQEAARDAYQQLLQQQQQQQQQQQWSWQEWAWALHMVQSRSIRLAQMGCKVMIPGIDLLNHGGSAANGQLVLGKASWQVEGEPAVCFVTTQDIAAGQQVLWSYGRRGNDDFFCYHGFVLGQNPDEDVVLFADVAELVGWALQELSQEVQELLGLRGQPQQQLLALAEAAAYTAAQDAAATCSSAAIPGTSSSLLAPAADLTAAVRQQQQQQQQQQQHGSSQQQQRQQQERWSAQLQGSRGSSSGSWRSSSSSSSDSGSGGSGQLERAVLASLKGLQLHRRLASFRLHSPEWGDAATCPPSAPELVLRQDGCLDVRLPAVLAALLDAAATAAGSSSSSGGGDCEAAGGGGAALDAAVAGVVRMRCRQLLQQMPTSLQQDREWLQQQQEQQAGSDGADGSSGLLSAVVQYRLAKKQLLAQFAEM